MPSDSKIADVREAANEQSFLKELKEIVDAYEEQKEETQLVDLDIAELDKTMQEDSRTRSLSEDQIKVPANVDSKAVYNQKIVMPIYPKI